MSSTTRTLAVALLVVGGVDYADWVMQLFVPVHADLTTSFISELGAGAQPHHALFRVADLAGGAALAAGAAAAWIHTRRWRATWLSLVLLGLCITVEAALPLKETFTFAAVLPKAGTHLWWGRVSEPHGVVSFLETIAFLIVFTTCTMALRRTGVSLTSRRVLVAVGVGAVLCGVLDAILTATLLMAGHAVALGLVQRVGVTLTAIWLTTAPTRLLARAHSHATPPEVRHDQPALRAAIR